MNNSNDNSDIIELMNAEYRDALNIQNACNLSGIVKSLNSALEIVWMEAREKGLGTDYVNTHPIVTLYISKLIDLNKYSDGEFSEAYSKASQIANDWAKNNN